MIPPQQLFVIAELRARGYLTLREIAAVWGEDYWTVKAMRLRGAFPAIRGADGRMWFVPAETPRPEPQYSGRPRGRPRAAKKPAAAYQSIARPPLVPLEPEWARWPVFGQPEAVDLGWLGGAMNREPLDAAPAGASIGGRSPAGSAGDEGNFSVASFLPGPAGSPQGSLSEEGLTSACNHLEISSLVCLGCPLGFLISAEALRDEPPGQPKPGTGGDRAHHAAGSRRIGLPSVLAEDPTPLKEDGSNCLLGHVRSFCCYSKLKGAGAWGSLPQAAFNPRGRRVKSGHRGIEDNES